MSCKTRGKSKFYPPQIYQRQLSMCGKPSNTESGRLWKEYGIGDKNIHNYSAYTEAHL